MKVIAAAFVKAQKEFAPALKTSTNPHFRSKYVALDGCIEAVLDALNNNGIALIQQTHDSENGIKIETILLHESGEQLSGGILHVPAPKQDPQGYGSALTYARRYSLMATCGIAPEDDDGNLATERAGSVVKKPQSSGFSFYVPNKEAVSCPDILTWEKNFDAMSEQLVNSSLSSEDKISKLKALVEANLPTLDRLSPETKVKYLGRQATRMNKVKGTSNETNKN